MERTGPPEISSLSYNEAKVINLARIYVSVKRVFLDRSSYARTSASEAPLYHQKNVVAYPQSPDAALRALGIDASVRRVVLDRSSYARTSASEAPLYHQKNVVAYPQSQDAALRAWHVPS